MYQLVSVIGAAPKFVPSTSTREPGMPLAGVMLVISGVAALAKVYAEASVPVTPENTKLSPNLADDRGTYEQPGTSTQTVRESSAPHGSSFHSSVCSWAVQSAALAAPST